VVSLHGHNHLGRATENALAAIAIGVRQLEGTINGVGPAGGNTNLVDVAQTLTPMASHIGIEFDADVVGLINLSNEPYFRN